MNVEEILIKLGMDTTSMSQGITRAKADVANLGEHIKKNFSGKEGEGLKSLFEKLTEMSPALGTAMKLAFNPIVGGFAAAATVFEVAREKLKAWNKDLDEQGARAAQPVGSMREAMAAARGKAAEGKQEFEWWRKDNVEGKPGDVEQRAIEKRLDQARLESGGDPIKLSKERLRIMEEEKAKAEAQQQAALGRASDLEKSQEDVKAIATQANRSAKIKDRLKEEERLAEEIKAQEAKVKEMKRSAVARVGNDLYEGNKADAALGALPMLAGIIPGVGSTVGDVPHQLMVKREQDKLDLLANTRQKTIEERKKLEEAELAGGQVVRENLHNLKETQAEADKAKERSLSLEKAMADERKTLFAEERKRREDDTAKAIELAEKKAGADKVAFLAEKLRIEGTALKTAGELGDEEQSRKLKQQMGIDQEELAKEEVNKAKAQEKLDRDLAYSKEKRKEHVNEPFLMTIDEIANSGAWDPSTQRDARRQRQQDQRDIRRGTAYVSKFAGMAQELKLTEEDAAMALRVDGPESSRYKDDLTKIDSLKKGLEKSGLAKGDVALDKIDKNIADLLEQARKEGLVVQPVNGK